MLKKKWFVVLACLFVFLSNGCSPQQPLQGSVGDPCAPGRIAATVKPFDSAMRAFEDATAIAYNMPRPQVSEQIATLQEYRREVADREAPACLADLKKAQVAYMDSVINTLLVFLEGAPGETTTQGLQTSLELKSRYVEVLESLLDLTLTPRPTQMRWTPQALLMPTEAIPVTGMSATPVATGSPSATSTLFSTFARVTNPDGANVRLGPDVFYEYALIIPFDVLVEVLGRTDDGEWFLIREPEMPEWIGWVFAPLVELDIPVEQVPVVMEIQTMTPTS